MSIGKAIFWKLSNDSGVTALVGGEIYGDSSPSNKYPMVAYNYVNNTENLLNGVPVTQDNSLTVVAIATDYDVAQDLAAAIVAALNRQSGSWNGVNVKGCFYKPDETEQTTSQGSPQLKYFSVSMTFRLLTY